MKRFIKGEYEEWLALYFDEDKERRNSEATKERLKEIHKKMCSIFPFLLPKNRFTGLVDPEYDYSYTEWCFLPYGWSKVFGYKLLKKLYKSLKFHRRLNDFKITDIKEREGHLDIYATYYDFTEKILKKYWDLSIGYCFLCGEPVRYYNGMYLCKSCFLNQARSVMQKAEMSKRRKYIIKSRLKEDNIPYLEVNRFGRIVKKKDKRYYKLWGIERKRKKQLK